MGWGTSSLIPVADWLLVCWQQSQWLNVISSQQDGSYSVEMVQEEQEVLNYSYSELVINCIVTQNIISLWLAMLNIHLLWSNK